MTAVDLASELRFEPSKPGSWDLDAVHFPRPATRYWSEMHPDAMKRGFREFTSYYGMLLDTLDYEYINGFAYTCPRPVGPEQAPERFRRAEEVFAKKLWRDQLRAWDETFKPASIRTHRELQSVDPDQLSDPELVEYLERCREHHKEMIYQHMRHSGAAMVCIGDLLAHASDWTGVPHAELLVMMRGSSSVSAGASGELARMVSAVKADSGAQEILGSDTGDPGETLERLRSLDGEAGDAVNGYLELIGYRPSTRTAPTRASPGSTSPCSTSAPSRRSARRCGRSGGRRTPTRRSPTGSGSACSVVRASASSSSHFSTPRSRASCSPRTPSTAPMSG